MSISVGDMKRVMANKTDEELYDVLHGHPENYTADALEAAKQEFASRNLTAPAITTLNSAVEEQKRAEGEPLTWPLRILAFFVSTVFFAIPVLIAHRYYVERGARGKAREWARWAFFGFLFYFALSVLTYTLPLFLK